MDMLRTSARAENGTVPTSKDIHAVIGSVPHATRVFASRGCSPTGRERHPFIGLQKGEAGTSFTTQLHLQNQNLQALLPNAKCLGIIRDQGVDVTSNSDETDHQPVLQDACDCQNWA